MKKFFVIFALAATISGSVFAESFDRPSGWDSVFENDLQVTIFAGQLAGDRISVAKNSSNEDVRVSNDDGMIMGVRLGKEVEYWGWEITLAGAYTDEEYKTFDDDSSGDASMLIVDFDFLFYPAGYDFAGETFRPFLCVGPGTAYYMSDSEYIDDDYLFGYNVGCGVKFDLGENLPDLRIDYRWHMLNNDDFDDQERTEFTIGLGMTF